MEMSDTGYHGGYISGVITLNLVHIDNMYKSNQFV